MSAEQQAAASADLMATDGNKLLLLLRGCSGGRRHCTATVAHDAISDGMCCSDCQDHCRLQRVLLLDQVEGVRIAGASFKSWLITQWSHLRSLTS